MFQKLEPVNFLHFYLKDDYKIIKTVAAII